MSLAFQKLNGQGTQMQNLIDAVNKSDLYKMALEFCLGKSLTPVAKSWNIGYNQNPNTELSFDGLYFGKWVMNHNSQDVGSSNNRYVKSFAELKYLGVTMIETSIVIHGDDVLAIGTETTEHLGFATSLRLHDREGDMTPNHSVNLSFIGYKLTQQDGFVIPPPVVTVNPNNDGKVHLTAQDLTSAGYTYQWSVTTGTGTFVNPNTPNAIFVPDGNGSYVLQLIVSDGSVNSNPVVVPVDVNLRYIELRNVSNYDILMETPDYNFVAGTTHKLAFNSDTEFAGFFFKPRYPWLQLTTKKFVNGVDVAVNTDGELPVQFSLQTLAIQSTYYEVSAYEAADLGFDLIDNLPTESQSTRYGFGPYSYDIERGVTQHLKKQRTITIDSYTPFKVVDNEKTVLSELSGNLYRAVYSNVEGLAQILPI